MSSRLPAEDVNDDWSELIECVDTDEKFVSKSFDVINEVLLVNEIIAGTRRAEAKPSPVDNILIADDELFDGGPTNLTNFVDEFVLRFPSTCWIMTLLLSVVRIDFLVESGVVTMVITLDGTTIELDLS